MTIMHSTNNFDSEERERQKKKENEKVVETEKLVYIIFYVAPVIETSPGKQLQKSTVRATHISQRPTTKLFENACLG